MLTMLTMIGIVKKHYEPHCRARRCSILYWINYKLHS